MTAALLLAHFIVNNHDDDDNKKKPKDIFDIWALAFPSHPLRRVKLNKKKSQSKAHASHSKLLQHAKTAMNQEGQSRREEEQQQLIDLRNPSSSSSNSNDSITAAAVSCVESPPRPPPPCYCECHERMTFLPPSKLQR